MPSIEEHLRRAMEEGQFDDLPGKGKPLRLEDDSLEDPEWRLAYHLLREGGFSLPWIELRQEIESEVEAAREALRCSWEWRLAALEGGKSRAMVGDEWRRAVEAFRERVVAINQRIADYNLQAPSEQLQRAKLNVDREVEEIQNR